jgi:hypothetical protein
LLEGAGGLVSHLEDDERADHFAAKRIGPARDGGLGDRGMLEESRLDLDRADSVVRDLDDLVRPADEPDVAVLVDVRGVPRVVGGGCAPSSPARSARARPRASGSAPGTAG